MDPNLIYAELGFPLKPVYLVMGVTRVGTVCVVLCSGDEERRVRGTGGVCRCGGDRGVEPVGINILVQLPRGSFKVVQGSRNRTRICTRTEQCPLTSSTIQRHVTARQGNPGKTSSGGCAMWQRGRMTAAFRLPTISTMSTKVAARSRIGAPAMPAAPGELRKAQASRRRRQKDSYGLLTKHLLQHMSDGGMHARRSTCTCTCK